MASHLDREIASPGLLILTVLAIQVLGILAMVLTGIWMKHYLGGFAWNGTEHEFDYHPLCMVISLVFLYSEGKIFTCFSMFQYHMRIMCTEGICRPSIGRHYRPICRPTGGRYLDRYSADMSTETRPSVGRHVV